MRYARVLLLLPVLAALTGCILAAAAAVGGGVFYVKGVASKTYPYSVEKTFQATVATLDDAGVTVFERNVDATSGKIQGRLADDKKLVVDFKSVGANVTEVRLRIGTWGDKDRSNYIFSRLDARLR